MLVLQRDGCKAVVDPSEAQLLQHLRRLKMVGRSHFLVLSTLEGNWIQVAGGSLCCIVERYCATSQVLWRAHRVKGMPVYQDASRFKLRGVDRAIQGDEILHMAEAEEIALAFRAGSDLSDLFPWRAMHFGEDASRALGFRDPMM